MTHLTRCLALLLTLLATSTARGAQEGADAAPAYEAGRTLVVVRVEGEISYGTLGLLDRALTRASELDAVCVIELDTPGGRVDLMEEIGRRIERARDEGGILVLAWVTDQAISAGAYIALSCDRILMREGTQIGAATPIMAGPAGATSVDKKFVSAFASKFRGIAERNGYPPAIAEGMVDGDVEVLWVLPGESDEPRAMTAEEYEALRRAEPGTRNEGRIGAEGKPITLTAREAFQFGLAEPAEELDDVLRGLIPQVYFEQPAILRVELAGAEALAQLLGTLGPILLIAGLALIYLEFQAPGLGLPSILAAVCFGLLIAGRYIAGLAGFEHVALIVLGLALIAVEIFVVPGTLIAGLAGGAALIAGLALSSLGDIDPLRFELDRYLLFQSVVNTVVWLALGAGLSMLISWLLPKTPVYSYLAAGPTEDTETFGSALGSRAEARPRQDLIGRLARATTALRPVGEVQVDGEGIVEFEAYALDGPWDPGQRVRIVSTEGGRLRVERAEDGEEGRP